jgi:cell wall assembly regulator SMI1
MNQQSFDVATDELIHQTEAELNIVLPDELKAIWRTHNCNALSGGWTFYPIFDPSNPRKTASALTYENLRGAWRMHIRSLGLLALASNGTGNHLVAKVIDTHVEPKIYHWHHETERLTIWKPGIAAVMKSAQASADALAKNRAKFGHGGG